MYELLVRGRIARLSFDIMFVKTLLSCSWLFRLSGYFYYFRVYTFLLLAIILLVDYYCAA